MFYKMGRIGPFLFWLFITTNLSAEMPDRQSLPPDVPQIEPVEKEDRILILAPHPDDEALGAGGIIQQAIKVGADVKILYLTNGELNQLAFIVYEKRLVIKERALIEMGKLRQKEAIAAMGLLGVNEENLIFLGYPDFGTLAIFLRHWGETKPFKNMLTKVSRVPYENALTPNAPYTGEAILWDIESVLKKYKPTKIFVTNPVDTNRDHRAFYLFLQIALWDLKDRIPKPKVYPYIIHCYGWPKPRNYHPSLYMPVPKALSKSPIEWLTHDLSPEEVADKYKAICLYKSQCSDSAFYLNSFARKNELFGSYPVIDANAPAKTGAQIATTFRDKTVVYARIGDNLLIDIYLKKGTSARHRFYVNLAGYRRDTEFPQMPKIKINVNIGKVTVLDRGKFIKSEDIVVEQKRHSVAIKIPLKILRDPEYILSSVNTHTDNFPSDLNAWRTIRLK